MKQKSFTPQQKTSGISQAGSASLRVWKVQLHFTAKSGATGNLQMSRGSSKSFVLSPLKKMKKLSI